MDWDINIISVENSFVQLIGYPILKGGRTYTDKVLFHINVAKRFFNGYSLHYDDWFSREELLIAGMLDLVSMLDELTN